MSLISWRGEEPSLERAHASGANFTQYILLFIICGLMSSVAASVVCNRVVGAYISLSTWFQTNVVACLGPGVCPGI